VLAAAEALLLGSGHDPAVDDECGGRVMEDGVYSQDVHWEQSAVSMRR
jgi:hypothetical protein